MSHKVLVDTSVQAYFEDSLWNQNPPAQEQVQSGLIIGQRSSTQDLIFGVFPTAAQEKQAAILIDEAWILEHAYQVSRMLCGGQFIMGLYVYTTTQRHSSLTGALQHVMTQLSKQNRDSLGDHSELANLYKDLLLFQLESNSNNKKMSCKLYNIEESKVNIKATELQTRSVLSNLHLLETNWSVEVTVPIIKDKILQEQIQDKIKSESSAIMASFALEKDQAVNNDESIVPASAEKKNKQGGAKKGGNKKKDDKSFNGSIPVHAISLLAVAGIVPVSSDQAKSANNNNEEQTTGSITIDGQLVGKAYINVKESWATAVKYLKLDLTHSLQTRFELLCETLEALEQDEKSEDPKTPYFNPLPLGVSYLLPHTWLLPRRVFTANNHMVYCDYLSSVDTIEDCVERFDAMLAIKTEPAKLDQSENFNKDVALDSEMMWSKRPIKKRANNNNNDTKKQVDREELLVDKDRVPQQLIELVDNIDPELLARTNLNVSGLVQPPEQTEKRSKWSMAILVLIIASILARVFLA